MQKTKIDSANANTLVPNKKSVSFTLGILFTMLVAFMGTALSALPVANRIGAMLLSILIAVAYRNIIGYPEKLKEGIKFSGQKILRLAIILYGFRLNIDLVLRKGALLLVHDVITIILAIVITVVLGKLLKAEKKLCLLLGVGTGVCGAAAIAAVSPIVKADEEDTAIGVGIIALVGTLFTLAYTFLLPNLNISPTLYGIWSGISLHEIAHVAAATGPAGADALAIGMLAKLGRVFLLIPLCFLLSWWFSRTNRSESTSQRPPFPWFLIGFILTSLAGTYLPFSASLLNTIAKFSSFLLASAMVGLGLNVHLSKLRSRSLPPLMAMLVASILVSIVSYLTLWF